mgnify:CR=1 FL=1
MKKLFFLFFFSAPLLFAAPLKISPQGQAEAQLYLDFLQGVIAEEQGSDLSCQHFQNAFAKAPQSKYLKQLLLICAISQKNMQEADQYADYISMGENDAKDLAVYGFYKWRKGDIAEAQKYYELALAKNPEDLSILYQYILLLSFIDVEKAAQKLEERKDNYPGLKHVIYYEIGNIYYAKKQYAKALEYYRKSTQQNPDYAPPYLARAEIYEHSSQFFLMLRELEELEKTGYQEASMFSRMGSVFIIVQDTEKAKHYFQKAKSLNKSDIPAGYFLAVLAEETGDFASAITYLQDTADYEQDAGKWLQVSFYQEQLKDEKAALQTLKTAYKKFEDNVEIAYFYALLLQQLEQDKKAVKVLKKVLQTSPNYEHARLALAYSLESLSKYEQMEQHLQILLEQNPKKADAYNLWGYSLTLRGVELDKAQELITQALALSPQDNAFIDSLAWLYYQKKDYQAALDLYKNMDPQFIENNAEVAYHVGAVYYQLNEREAAEKYLTMAAKQEKAAKKLLKKIHKQALQGKN